MENMTLNELSNLLIFIITFVSSIGTLLIGIKKIFNKQLKPLEESIEILDKNQCKNYLVRFLADIEREKILMMWKLKELMMFMIIM